MTASYQEFAIPLPVPMRATPALTGVANTGYRIFVAIGGAGETISSTAIYGSNGTTVIAVTATATMSDSCFAFASSGGLSVEL